MRRPNLLLTALFALSAIACSGSPPHISNRAPTVTATSPPVSQDGQIADVSIVQLVANPERYHGKPVRVIGFARLEFEGDAIYLHREDYENGLDKNGLWLSVTDQVREESDKYSDKYVLVEGTFNSQNRGHWGMKSGAIENIRRFQVWPSEREK